jgi:hypothetical protein
MHRTYMFHAPVLDMNKVLSTSTTVEAATTAMESATAEAATTAMESATAEATTTAVEAATAEATTTAVEAATSEAAAMESATSEAAVKRGSTYKDPAPVVHECPVVVYREPMIKMIMKTITEGES